MLKTIAPVAALLLSVAFLLMGNGLQGTLLAVRGDMESFSTVSIGILGSTYFMGFGLGCAMGSNLIRRVGHIRTFTAMAAIASAVPLAHGLFLHPVPWWLMRAVTGFCFAVLYIVIESWLNERSTNKTRGTIISVYLVINLTVMTLGQMMLTLEDPAGFALFAITSILVSVSAVPIAITSISAPAPPTSTSIRLSHLYRNSPVASIGCLAVGLSNGTYWTLAPLFAQRMGMDVEGIALFMSAGILGGAIGQWPIGWLSDQVDRRWVLIGSSIVAAICGFSIYFLGVFTDTYNLPLLLILAGLWGMSAFPLYAISIAHANDHAEPEEYVAVSSGMLMIFAAGSIIGPLIASSAMGLMGAHSIFAFTAAVHLMLCLYTAWRVKQRVAPVEEDHVTFAEALVSAHTVSDTFDAALHDNQVSSPIYTDDIPESMEPKNNKE